MSALPGNSLVLVSGANGMIAGHVVGQLLKSGFRVRGTVRDESKGDWIKEYAEKHYGPGKVEIVVVKNMSEAEAFKDA